MKKLSYLFVFLFLLSCGEDLPEEKSEQVIIDERAKVIYDSTRIEERKSFFGKYSPISLSDSAFKFTYQLQEFLLNSNGYHSIKGNIVDIVKKDGFYFLKIAGAFSRHITILELSINDDMLEKINDFSADNKKLTRAEFVFELINFETSSGFKAKTIESEDSHFDIKYDFLSVTYFIKGNLVDFLPTD